MANLNATDCHLLGSERVQTSVDGTIAPWRTTVKEMSTLALLLLYQTTAEVPMLLLLTQAPVTLEWKNTPGSAGRVVPVACLQK